MKKTILKLAVIASSVLLAAGFISYRAGAFSWLTPASVQPVHSGTETPSTTVDLLPAVMSGSKASFPSPLPPSAAGTQPSTGTPPLIMSGSKSLAPLIPPAQNKTATQAPADSQATKPNPK
jgi:hypothetical protein